jgi:hypothetical protein
LVHFTWSCLDVSCCMGNAWVGPSGFFFGRHMGCKFNDSWELLCGITFKAGCEAGPSGFYIRDTRLMTAVYSRLVILDTCHRVGFFANLSDRLYMFSWEGCSPLIIHVCMVAACLGIC